MNWKEFLKPDWRRIVITIIFLILTIVSYVSAWLFGQMFKSGVLFLILLGLSMVLAFPFFLIGSIFSSELIELISLFIYWYLLSCLIVWIYDKKFKKVKKK